ncbi:MAG: hypothetical protein RJB66_725 [Pseudomonadota bacterium]|jgi:uncharacterized protein YqeY
MEIRERIMNDIKVAMKEKNQVRLNALRFLQSAIKNREIDMRPNPITHDEVIGVIKRLVKQRKESIDQYRAGGRQDLVDQETTELGILEELLPAQLSSEQVESIVKEVVTALNAKSPKDMGGVIKEVIVRTQGNADNKLVSELVKKALNP